jgi:aspartyl-tRNA synthetase
MASYRTHKCNELRETDVTKEVVLSGWVHNRRDHGGVLFLDLRDHFGITQLVINENVPFYEEITHLQKENVIKVKGQVKHRDPELRNPEIETGDVEVVVEEYEVLGPAAPLPFSVFPEDPTSEELRLKYRFLDLRRETLHESIVLRSKIVKFTREKMHEMGFLEMQTPILTASSPEGARDFLVPSRLHPGQFYALPQAPQQFKQLLMVAGFDRYFQIAPCFRDEDARANRSPGEFYQIDLEMAFAEQDDIFEVVENLMFSLFEAFSDELKPVDEPPFIRIPYAEAMSKYGSDKPDLRIPIELNDVADIFEASNFDMFKKQVKKGAEVKAIPVKGVASRGKPFCESMLAFATSKPVGAKGLAYIIWKDGEASGKPITNHLNADEIEAIREKCGLGDGDVVFFVCDKPGKAAPVAGRVREEVGRRLSLDIQTFAPSELESADDDAGVKSLYDRIVSAAPELEGVRPKEAALKAITLSAVADNPRALFEEIVAEAKADGIRCPFYIIYKGGKPEKSELAALISDKDLKIINDKIQPNKNQDVVFFIYDKGAEATKGARRLRKSLSARFHLPQVDEFRFCWIVDFPMYEKDEKTGKVEFSHNPFSMPQGGLKALNDKDPLDILAYQYDIVCNGEELSSGAVRNHRPDIMYKAFDIAGYTQKDVDEKFGGMITAFRLGAPPHAGIAPGLDRIVMLLANKQNLREIVAFPMNQMAQDLMMQAPREVSEEQLKELSLKIDVIEDT